jgi:hypothetical protein
VHVEVRIDERALDVLSLARTLTVEQGEADGHRRRHPCCVVSDCGCELCWTAIGFADQRGDARIGRAHIVEAGFSTEWPGLPGQGNRAHDERRMNGAQFVIAEARPCHHTGGEILNQHIDLRYDRPDELTAARLLDIDGQALFRVIVLKKVRALRARLEFNIARLVTGRAAAVAIWRQFNLDDLSAQLCQYPCTSWPRDELGDVKHAIAREHWQFGSHRRLAVLI